LANAIFIHKLELKKIINMYDRSRNSAEQKVLTVHTIQMVRTVVEETLFSVSMRSITGNT